MHEIAYADRRREARLRSLAARQNLGLAKSRARIDCAERGTFMIFDIYTSGVVALGLSGGFGLDLDEVEAFLAP